MATHPPTVLAPKSGDDKLKRAAASKWTERHVQQFRIVQQRAEVELLVPTRLKDAPPGPFNVLYGQVPQELRDRINIVYGGDKTFPSVPGLAREQEGILYNCRINMHRDLDAILKAMDPKEAGEPPSESLLHLFGNNNLEIHETCDLEQEHNLRYCVDKHHSKVMHHFAGQKKPAVSATNDGSIKLDFRSTQFHDFIDKFPDMPQLIQLEAKIGGIKDYPSQCASELLGLIIHRIKYFHTQYVKYKWKYCAAHPDCTRLGCMLSLLPACFKRSYCLYLTGHVLHFMEMHCTDEHLKWFMLDNADPTKGDETEDVADWIIFQPAFDLTDKYHLQEAHLSLSGLLQKLDNDWTPEMKRLQILTAANNGVPSLPSTIGKRKKRSDSPTPGSSRALPVILD